MNNKKSNETTLKALQIPLDLLIIQARQGNEAAAEAFCQWATPIVRQFSTIPYFVKSLDRSEIQSLLNLTLTEFLMEYPEIPSEEEIPRLLRKILKNGLLFQIRKKKQRSKYHCQELSGTEKRNGENEETEAGHYIADSALQPEHVLLQQELAHTVTNALNQLRATEHHVLYGLYFEGKDQNDLVREMNYTFRQIRYLHKQGLKHLRKILTTMRPGLLLSDLKAQLV